MSKNSQASLSVAEIIKEANKRSFAEEIENDKEKSRMLLKRVDQAEEQNADPRVIKQERDSADVYKRALLLIGSGNMQIQDALDKKISAADNRLPVSSYLSHGSRVMIEIPANTGDKLMNWLTSSDETTPGMSRKQHQDKAILEDKIVYNRSAATHAVKFKRNKEGALEAKEQKGKMIGAQDFLLNKLFNKNTPHWGVDLAMNAEFNSKDPAGKIVDRPDGDHGHLYIYYTAPTKKEPGAMLIGIEGGSPASSKHSAQGTANPLSAVDSSKFDKLAAKHKENNINYETTIIPNTVNGMKMKLTEDQLRGIIKLDQSKYGVEMSYVNPSNSPEGFTNQLEGTRDYQERNVEKQNPVLTNITTTDKSLVETVKNTLKRSGAIRRVKPKSKQNLHKNTNLPKKAGQAI